MFLSTEVYSAMIICVLKIKKLFFFPFQCPKTCIFFMGCMMKKKKQGKKIIRMHVFFLSLFSFLNAPPL